MVLILIIIGLTFICILIFEYLETFILWIGINSCCRCDKRLHHVIKKNMEAHRHRNSKTSLMFTLATSFLIFSASTFALIGALIVKTAEAIIGSDIKVASPYNYLNEKPIAEFLTNQMAGDNPTVADYSFISCSTEDFASITSYWTSDNSFASAGGSSPHVDMDYYGVPRNLLNVLYSDFYIPYEL